MSDAVIRRAARALNPDRPVMILARIARRPRSTVRSWATGHRRPPIVALEFLRDLLKEREIALSQLIPELERGGSYPGLEIGKLASVLGFEPAELLRLPTKR